MRGLALLLVLSVSAGLTLGCDDEKPKPNPFAAPSKDTKEPPPLTEPPKLTGPPDLVIDNLGAKVGWTRVLVEKPDGRDKLSAALAEHKQHLDGKDVTLRVDRKGKSDWVVMLMDELVKVGATKVLVKTDTRAEFPKEILFTPQQKIGQLEPCTVVATILADRGTAVWKISGGTASKRTKGFAGPDLTMTGDTLERYGKACKTSKTLLVSGAEEVEWGLVYDLAASAKKLQDVTFDQLVLLRERPIAGRKVVIDT
jgi:biopolymer transport protein ExbD